MKKLKHIINRPESGLALISLIIVMLILGVVAYTFVTIISTHRTGFPVTESSLKAFYITEGALEIGKKYVADRWATETTVALGPDFCIFTNESLGDGTFSLWVTESDVGFVTFTATADVNY
ncbi:MAG: hypothetical protein U9N73_08280 [Candidatus Auribacterota bacterium]|nr:hypothetical protein [Candidatus Auribacterota bacterium]